MKYNKGNCILCEDYAYLLDTKFKKDYLKLVQDIYKTENFKNSQICTNCAYVLNEIDYFRKCKINKSKKDVCYFNCSLVAGINLADCLKEIVYVEEFFAHKKYKTVTKNQTICFKCVYFIKNWYNIKERLSMLNAKESSSKYLDSANLKDLSHLKSADEVIHAKRKKLKSPQMLDDHMMKHIPFVSIKRSSEILGLTETVPNPENEVTKVSKSGRPARSSGRIRAVNDKNQPTKLNSSNTRSNNKKTPEKENESVKRGRNLKNSKLPIKKVNVANKKGKLQQESQEKQKGKGQKRKMNTAPPIIPKKRVTLNNSLFLKKNKSTSKKDMVLCHEKLSCNVCTEEFLLSCDYKLHLLLHEKPGEPIVNITRHNLRKRKSNVTNEEINDIVKKWIGDNTIYLETDGDVTSNVNGDNELENSKEIDPLEENNTQPLNSVEDIECSTEHGDKPPEDSEKDDSNNEENDESNDKENEESNDKEIDDKLQEEKKQEEVLGKDQEEGNEEDQEERNEEEDEKDQEDEHETEHKENVENTENHLEQQSGDVEEIAENHNDNLRNSTENKESDEENEEEETENQETAIENVNQRVSNNERTDEINEVEEEEKDNDANDVQDSDLDEEYESKTTNVDQKPKEICDDDSNDDYVQDIDNNGVNENDESAAEDMEEDHQDERESSPEVLDNPQMLSENVSDNSNFSDEPEEIISSNKSTANVVSTNQNEGSTQIVSDSEERETENETIEEQNNCRWDVSDTRNINNAAENEIDDDEVQESDYEAEDCSGRYETEPEIQRSNSATNDMQDDADNRFDITYNNFIVRDDMSDSETIENIQKMVNNAY